ncbi:MAG: hypothetical protein WC476_05620 [Phycisphaerae bacterium]
MRLLNKKICISLLAASVFVLTALDGTRAYAGPVYTANTEFLLDKGDGTYVWRTDIFNITPESDADSSGVSVILYTGNTSNHSFGGDVGDPWWQLINSNALSFSAEAWEGEGFIDLPALNPNTDMLCIFYDSPYNTLIKSRIEVQTFGNGTFTIEDVLLPGELTADLNGDHIVNLLDFAILAGQWQSKEPNVTDLTHYEHTVDLGNDNFISVFTNTYLDSGMRIFDYGIENNSGDTILNINQIGEDWVGSGGINLNWVMDIIDSPVLNQDVIRFYDNSFLPGNNEELITGSNWTDTWGIRPMELKGLSGETYTLNVLAPNAAVSLEADIIDDGMVDINDLQELCSQWLETEVLYE